VHRLQHLWERLADLTGRQRALLVCLLLATGLTACQSGPQAPAKPVPTSLSVVQPVTSARSQAVSVPGTSPAVQAWMKRAEPVQIELNDSVAAVGPAVEVGVASKARPLCSRLVRAAEAVLALPPAPLPGLREELAAGAQDLHRAGLTCLAGDEVAARAHLDAARAARTGSEERVDKLLFGTAAD
jgi:hypothetical protein